MENYIKQILNEFNPSWCKLVEAGRIGYTKTLAKAIEQKISKAQNISSEMTLLKLIDSLLNTKNSETVGVDNDYIFLFGQSIAEIFASVFRHTMELPSEKSKKMREDLYNLRKSWTSVFSPIILKKLDINVKRSDRNWPLAAHSIPALMDGLYEDEMERYSGVLEIRAAIKELTKYTLIASLAECPKSVVGIESSSSKSRSKRTRKTELNQSEKITGSTSKKWCEDVIINARNSTCMMVTPPYDDEIKQTQNWKYTK